MMKSLISRFFQNKKKEKVVEVRIIPHFEHNISRDNISENAVKVLYRLKKSGYQAYLVGGGVRDLLLGREPKDFDIATDAHPEDVKRAFRNCRLIGRRFRLAHVHFGQEIIEVATFRSMQGAVKTGDRQTENGMLVRDNVYGTIEEDALRRDFTINALYYSIEDFSVIDYADGLNDLEEGVLRLLGDPETRFREDPVRMLRAVRFAAKLGFNIDPLCEEQLSEIGDLLQSVPAARLFEEVLKLFISGVALRSFEKLRHYGLFGELFPDTEECLAHEEHAFPITFVVHGMKNTDTRIREGKSVTPAFLFAVLLWEPVRLFANELRARGEPLLSSMQQAGNEVLMEQLQHVSIPKRFSLPMREIWNLQHRFEQRLGKRPHRLLAHPKFRAAYDFLCLRAESGETDIELAEWWTRFQEVSGEARDAMANSFKGTGNGKKCRRRRRKPRTRPIDSN
ncbi:polynucleotide adenylyltransferase PcnB [Candidatus Vondammii sp. HM_W22]|uniref:polynucleotide adenylyltransferase PcnB n=1 Tax=Candidatus Vondammii sp. HM_W22 TaxID=2687299 RepID=UPI00403D9A83